MKPIPILLAAMAITLLCAACLPDSQGGGVDWPEVAHCGPSVPDLVSDVSHVLLAGGDPAPQLRDLAVEHGADVVVCLVDLLRRDWTAPGSAPEPHRLAAARRAQDWLTSVGTRVEHDGEPTSALRLYRTRPHDALAGRGFAAHPAPDVDQRLWRALLARARG
jgi:hypothetical protein